MKRIVCNICNGLEFRMISSNEYRCQGCGMVYTADQIRSLLRETDGKDVDTYSIDDNTVSESFAESELDHKAETVAETAAETTTETSAETTTETAAETTAETAAETTTETVAETGGTSGDGAEIESVILSDEEALSRPQKSAKKRTPRKSRKAAKEDTGAKSAETDQEKETVTKKKATRKNKKTTNAESVTKESESVTNEKSAEKEAELTSKEESTSKKGKQATKTEARSKKKTSKQSKPEAESKTTSSTESVEKKETSSDKEEQAKKEIEYYSKIAAKNKKVCPKCGSKNIEVDGILVNRKKGLGYYLFGQAAYDMGIKHGSFIADVLGSEDSKPNAKCLDCDCEWRV